LLLIIEQGVELQECQSTIRLCSLLNSVALLNDLR